MRTISRHVLAELYRCDDALLEDLAAIRLRMLATAHLIGATVVGEVFHHFSPHGVSGVVVIAESHLSIHTWPENSYAAIDIFTCGELDPVPGVASLAKELSARQYRMQEILRGLSAELNAQARSPIGNYQLITSMAPLYEMQGPGPESFSTQPSAYAPK
jgi:S-adenosylmethionine decarboxylase